MEFSQNQSIVDADLKTRIAGLYSNMSRRLGVKQAPKIVLTQNQANAKEPFGKTAYYDPKTRLIRVYISERHPTDILRSFAHELIHHWQNEHGALPSTNSGQDHYAQKDPVLRRREMEAYLLGNMLFRDWQDEQRYGPINENLMINNPDEVKTAIKKLLFNLVKQHALDSYHRDATSGDMNPNDFVEELTRKIELAIEKFFETVNNRGNRENQADMIGENKISRSELKRFIKERLSILDSNNADKNLNYAQWVKKFAAKQNDIRKGQEKYFTIGFDRNDDSQHYCWYWDGHKIVMARGGSHSNNFGNKIPFETFRGRYDLITKNLSITIPEYGPMKITGDVKKDVPPELIRALNKTFPGHKLHYFPHPV